MDNIVNFADKKRSSLLMHFANTKSKLIEEPIRGKENITRSQWHSVEITSKLCQARETSRDQAAIGFNFDVDWLRERRRFSDKLPKGVYSEVSRCKRLKLWQTEKLSDFSMMKRICMGRGKDIRLTFVTHDCVKTRKKEMVYLVKHIYDFRIRNIFMAACSERRCI